MAVTKQMVEEYAAEIEHVHDESIERFSGENGIRDKGGLHHAAFEILKAAESDKPFHVAAVIYSLLATRHYFVDGNKRTAHAVAHAWLLSYGYDLKIPYSEAVPFIIDIAHGKPVAEIEKWIETNADKTNV